MNIPRSIASCLFSSLLMLALITLFFGAQSTVEAKKGSIYVLGTGCNALVYKTHGKKGNKGETVVMGGGCGSGDNFERRKDDYEDKHHQITYPVFIPYPTYGHSGHASHTLYGRRKRRSLGLLTH